MNNTMITIPYADAIEYGENTSALFKALWELTDLIRLETEESKTAMLEYIKKLPQIEHIEV